MTTLVALAIATMLAGCFSVPAPGVTPTPDVALVAARQTIDAVLLGGKPDTPTPAARPADVTPSEIPVTHAPVVANLPSSDRDATATQAAQAAATVTAAALTAQVTPTVTPDLAAIQAADMATAVAATLTAQATSTPTLDLAATQAAAMATAVAATLTAQATPTPTPDLAATQVAAMATAVAATLTAQATSTRTPDFAATQGVLLATAIAKTLTAQPTPAPTRTATTMPTRIPTSTSTPIPTVSSPYADLAGALRQRAQSSWVPANYTADRDRFIAALIDHLGEFQLPNLGITTRTMSDALRRNDAGDRVNAIVNQVWGDWLTKDVGPGRLDAYRSDPGQANLSPFRQLVIRLIQGRQGRLADNQQHALYSLFTRSEETHVWVDDVNGVIGAINRESFLWP